MTQQGNAVVVIQYRLGVMGFLNSFDEKNKKTVGGNYGLHDISLALDFVHRNAEYFGNEKLKYKFINQI